MTAIGAAVYLLLALGLLVAMNRGAFAAIGWAGTLRLALVWGAIFAVAVLAVSLIGVPEHFRR